jgi:cytochrome c556
VSHHGPLRAVAWNDGRAKIGRTGNTDLISVCLFKLTNNTEKRMRVQHLITTSIIGLSLLSQPILAAKDPNEAAIGARQGYMQNVVFNVGPLFGMAKGKMDYNGAMASELAQNLLKLTEMNTGRMWRKGSDHDQYDESDALTKIWESPEDFTKRQQAFIDAIAALAPEAGNGLDALRSKINGVGKSCKGCHDDFRAE